MSTTRPIVFLSDFGLGNEWVGICHSVMSGIAPQCPIADLSHLIRPMEVTSGALLLADSVPYIPENAVSLAVVEPNVGKDRELAIETTSGRAFVGPDNGLLSLAWEAAGGIVSAVELTSRDVIRRPHAESFRAPDTLCPAAARLASGMSIDQLGTHLDPSTLAVISVAEPEIEPGKIACEVIDFNRFGNVHLNVRPAHLAAANLDEEPMIKIEAISGSAQAKRGSTYADFPPGEYGLLFDPRGWLTIVRGNPASAIEGLGLDLAAPVWLTPAVTTQHQTFIRREDAEQFIKEVRGLPDPMLSRSGPLPTGPTWFFELKWDGFRHLVRCQTRGVAEYRLLSHRRR